MGEVYRAKDTKLGREVAIKLLLDEVSTDPERLARFEREARVLASLNHNNIATLYGFEKEGDTNFLVMELVEGETLAERIKRGAVPVDEALPVFLQIAEGLEAAHEKGVIHRDLKPANIKVTDDGNVKILDFGLAKAMAPATGPESDSSESPTLTYAATRQGQILGTAAYMSPEQAKGREVDKRADVWAFGACLYEALAGRRAFEGDDAADTLAAVLRAELDWGRLAPTPRAIQRLLRRCLKREPSERLRDIGDARFEIEEARDAATDPNAGSEFAVTPTKVRGRVALALAVGLAAGMLLTTLIAPRNEKPVTLRPARLSITGANGRGLEGLRELALSPDGLQLVFVAQDQLHLRRIADPSSQPLAGTRGAQFPLFSPDGEWIAFFQGTELKRLPTQGGGSPGSDLRCPNPPRRCLG